MMRQHLGFRAPARSGDACHQGDRPQRRVAFILLLAASLVCLGVPAAHAQTSGSLQVAAKVVSTEPSRSAIALASAALETPFSTVRESNLARVRVEPRVSRNAAEPRRVRVDYLRN